MKDSSGNGVVVVAMGLILILLLLVGGVGVYFVVARQQAALAIQAERARMAEVQARMRAEQARLLLEAQVARNSAAASNDKEFSADKGDSIRAAVESILRAQEEAWNRGDLDAFMEHYWKSEALTFSSGGKTTRGWAATLERYRERYPTAEEMGRLRMSNLEITPLGDFATLVLGQWNLERENEPLSGNFSLTIRKFDDRWLIVHDHTSRLVD